MLGQARRKYTSDPFHNGRGVSFELMLRSDLVCFTTVTSSSCRNLKWPVAVRTNRGGGSRNRAWLRPDCSALTSGEVLISENREHDLISLIPQLAHCGQDPLVGWTWARLYSWGSADRWYSVAGNL